jgi:hypothetical protein
LFPDAARVRCLPDAARFALIRRRLPILHGEFAAGRFSYSKTRAIARIATPDTDADLVAMCTPMTAAQAGRFAAAVGSCGPGDDQDLAGALTEVAGAYLRGKTASAGNADIYQVQIHVVPDILDRVPVPAGTPDGDPVPAGTDGEPVPAGTDRESVPAGTPGMSHPCRPGRCHLEDGPAISPADAQRIACTATLSAMLHNPADGTILDAGRRSRSATAAIRRAVRDRDGARCCHPGCDSRRTDLHHMVWWRHGGRTSMNNLIPLCGAHHTLVHATAAITTRHGPGQYSFTNPATGRVITPHGTLPAATAPIDTTHDAGITEQTIQQAAGERLDLHYAVWVALHNGRNPETTQDDTALAA